MSTNSTSKHSFGKVVWKCPSNIALIKYWGKKGKQIPLNPSLSMTLKNSHTITELSWEKGSGLSFYFEGKENEAFKSKIGSYLDSLPHTFLKDYHFTIRSENTFPHSAGIASSASSMGALGLCLSSFISNKIDQEFFENASNLARLGSGSACRSIYGNMTSWGDVSDQYATPIDNLHQNFKGMKNSILIVDRGVKKVSSTGGHALMNNHPCREERPKEAYRNFKMLKDALLNGDLDTFGRITEQEALNLHGMMLTSTPPFILMRPKTLSLIEKIRDFRKKTGLHLYFTLDAGPNIHLLYPNFQEKEILGFIKGLDVEVIFDEMGDGPLQLSFEGEVCGS